MRIFSGGEPERWSSKINFVDKNNVLVGFDDVQNCCERFGWFLSRKPPDPGQTDEGSESYSPEALEPYTFDPDYFRELSPQSEYSSDCRDSVVFRLVNGEEELFLTLYNHHNGYYSHGFSMSRDGSLVREGGL